MFSSFGATSVDAVGAMVGAGLSWGVGVLVGTFVARSSSIGAVGGVSGAIADDGVATAGGTVFLGLSTLSFHSLRSCDGVSGFLLSSRLRLWSAT